jgi:type 1 glutamine amidotransferase
MVLAPGAVGNVAPPKNFLVFSKTTGFRHDTIPDGSQAIAAFCKDRKWNVDFTEDSNEFTPENLAKYDCVVFFQTTGDVLNDDEKQAMQDYVEKQGGGYVGVHSASDTEYKWPWYGTLVGAWFNGHPAQQQATVHIENKRHPSTKFLPDPWVRFDEWYNFKTDPRSQVTVLATVDESTYKGGTMGADHPIMWCHDVGKGRSWYTAMGHTHESYKDPLYLRMLAEGMNWASAHHHSKD